LSLLRVLPYVSSGALFFPLTLASGLLGLAVSFPGAWPVRTTVALYLQLLISGFGKFEVPLDF
jgi:hypothetical protein